MLDAKISTCIHISEILECLEDSAKSHIPAQISQIRLSNRLQLHATLQTITKIRVLSSGVIHTYFLSSKVKVHKQFLTHLQSV